jgi:UDP-glucose 4-epimerase
MNVLVAGGAGYIGSHMVRALVRAGHRVTVLDDLSSGHRWAVAAEVALVEGRIEDTSAVTELLLRERVEAVFHFAALIQVGESVRDPRRYYLGNTAATVRLLEAVLDAKVGQLVFSSTAAVYGTPTAVPIPEEHAKAPVNPYGHTKWMIEQVLAEYARAYPLQVVALRYFNAAGADPSGDLGEDHHPESHLVPLVLDAAMGRRQAVQVFGDDYPTRDGTCVRDYVHVSDLASAHLRALEYLRAGGQSRAFNLGTGVGQSVLEVIHAAEAVTGRAVPVQMGPRRDGDSAELVARVDAARRELGWVAERSSLETILADAWRFHAKRFAK